MSNCNSCNQNPCGCGSCEPARYSCGFDIQADPFDSSTWIFNNCGQLHRIKIPKIAETCTHLSTDFSTASLIYNGECGIDTVSGTQIGELINLDDLRDVEVPEAESCDLLVFDPGCTACGNGCKPRPAMWRNYHIPDAGDCEIEPDMEGYYHVLVKDDCGCIKECRLPSANASVSYLRDAVPDDPDFPWYYGCYNDRIDLYLEDGAPEFFGKCDLEVTVTYTIQVTRPGDGKNMNFRSLVAPIYEGKTSDNDIKEAIQYRASILQDDVTSLHPDNITGPDTSGHSIPWGTKSMRGMLVFTVPKGKKAYLHHEFRLMSWDSINQVDSQGRVRYAHNPAYDGKIVPAADLTHVNDMKWNGSRLDSLSISVRPSYGTPSIKHVSDTARNKLDAVKDYYPTTFVTDQPA